jgi:hypothetical protein
MSRLRAGIEASRPSLGPTQPPLHCVLAPSPDIKRSELEADHSSPFGCDIKNKWSYTFIPTFLHVVHRDLFLLVQDLVDWRVAVTGVIHREMVKNEL